MANMDTLQDEPFLTAAIPKMSPFKCRLSHLIFGLLISFVVAFGVVTTWRSLLMVNQPFPGFCYLDIGQGYLFVNALNQTHWAGFEQGLQLLDIVTKVEGQAPVNHQLLTDILQQTEMGQSLAYTVLRQGELLTLQIPVRPFSWLDFVLVVGLCNFAGLVLLVMATSAYILRYQSPGTWAFVLFSLVFSIYIFSGVEASINQGSTLLFWVSGGIMPATVAQLTAQFPRRNTFCSQHRWLLPLLYLMGLLLGLWPFTHFAPTDWPQFIPTMLVLSLVVGFAAGLFFFASMVKIYRSQEIIAAQATLVKMRVKLLIFGAMMAFGLPGILACLTVVIPSLFIPFNYLALLLIIFPLTASLAIIKYQLFQVDFYIKKILAVFLILDVTILLYFIFYIILEKLQWSAFRQSPIFTLGFTFLILLMISPLYQWISGWIEQLMSKNQKQFFQAAAKLNQKMARVRNPQEIMDLFVRLLYDVLKVNQIAVWHQAFDAVYRFEHGQGLPPDADLHTFLLENKTHFQTIQNPLFLEQIPTMARLQPEVKTLHLKLLQNLNTILFIPIYVQEQLISIFLLSGKANADPFSGDELNLLESLGYQTAIALENARYYQTVKDLNDNLEVKVATRTQELTQAIAAQEKTQAQLVRSESLAAIGQLVAGVAHELNNPLGSAHSLVQSAIEILEEQTEINQDQEDVIDDLKFVLKEQTRAKDIVGSLLDLSRQTTSYEEPVQLNLVVEDAIRILHNKYKYLKLNLVQNLAHDLPLVQGNFAQLGQVCLNLIQNAIQAVGETQGQIHLETGQTEAELYFRCADNGPGVSEAAMQDIFKPFFTTKTVGEGTGLGLYICHEIIERHGGRFKVRNLSAGGACFEFWLPR